MRCHNLQRLARLQRTGNSKYVKCFVAGQAQRLSRGARAIHQRQHSHAHQIAAMDALK